jgi:sugar-specific transcriptional regulator TrmB
MHTIQNHLLHIGFSKQEARVLEVLVISSPLSASFIARRSGMARSSVYTILAALVQKGVVSSSVHVHAARYSWVGILAFERRVEEQKKHLRDISESITALKSELDSLPCMRAIVPTVTYFEGYQGVKEMYMEVLHALPPASELMQLRSEFVWDEAWKFIFEKPWNVEVEKIKTKKKISSRLLVNSSLEEKKHKELYKNTHGLRVRLLPKINFFDGFALYITSTHVAMVSISPDGIVGTLMRSPHIASQYMSLYEHVWTHARAV